MEVGGQGASWAEGGLGRGPEASLRSVAGAPIGLTPLLSYLTRLYE